MSVARAAARFVQQRANGRCEYCRMHEALQGATFHVEHVIPSAADGSDEDMNLAWACVLCNLKKSKRTRIVDPQTGDEVAFFNPRTERWEDHFEWSGLLIKAKTATGRALIDALDLNHPHRLFIREAENSLGLFAG